jgi:propanol-preferring alcohol dehydrogenase
VVVDVQTLVRVPEAVPVDLAAAGTDAGMTSYHAVIVKGQVKAGDRVGVIGLGGLGQIGARLAVLAGADVYVAEIDRGAWPIAEELGAIDVKPSIADFGDVAFDVVVDFAGFGTTTAQAIEAVRVGGHVVQVGLGRFEATISTRALISRRATLVGSQGGTKDDIRAVYDHFASGAVTPRVTEIGFDGIPDGLERLREGRVVGRLVANLTRSGQAS